MRRTQQLGARRSVPSVKALRGPDARLVDRACIYPARETDKQFLGAYEKAGVALAADDLTGAKAAAKELDPDGADLAKSSSLKEA
jgi:hypothetical protein